MPGLSRKYKCWTLSWRRVRIFHNLLKILSLCLIFQILAVKILISFWWAVFRNKKKTFQRADRRVKILLGNWRHDGGRTRKDDRWGCYIIIYKKKITSREKFLKETITMSVWEKMRYSSEIRKKTKFLSQFGQIFETYCMNYRDLQVCRFFGTSSDGLSDSQVEELRNKYGENGELLHSLFNFYFKSCDSLTMIKLTNSKFLLELILDNSKFFWKY